MSELISVLRAPHAHPNARTQQPQLAASLPGVRFLTCGITSVRTVSDSGVLALDYQCFTGILISTPPINLQKIFPVFFVCCQCISQHKVM